jgi:hypothetical protein
MTKYRNLYIRSEGDKAGNDIHIYSITWNKEDKRAGNATKSYQTF